MASKKQRVWLEEYLKCWNATEAARRANYTHPNKRGPENLAKFKAEISERLDEVVMSADEVLARLAEQARCEYATYIGDDGKVDLAQLKADDKMYLVKCIKETRYGQQVEFYDGQTALVQIGKHHGLFVDRFVGEIDTSSTVNVLMSPEWITARSVLMQALGPYPEARAAVAAALLEIAEVAEVE